MRTNLAACTQFQVFLNYPFDSGFEGMSRAMHFGVIAAGLVPICAKDLSVPDRPRLEILTEALQHSQYSAHDLSRCRGEGEENLARFNVPLEMGMALGQAFMNKKSGHRCAVFVPSPHLYKTFNSDLAGLDPICHHDDEHSLVAGIYEWLRNMVGSKLLNKQPTVSIVEKYSEFELKLAKLRGSEHDGRPSHDESQELMYRLCAEYGWWDWRAHRGGLEEFPVLDILFNS